jgi:hypothetical protein
LCLIHWACRKNETVILPKFQDPFVASAVDYLKPQISNQDFQRLGFKSVQVLKTGSVTTGVVIRAKNKSDLRSIIMVKKGNSFKGNWLSVEYKGAKDNGIIHTVSFDENTKSDIYFIHNKVTKIVKTKNGVTKTTVITFRKKNQLAGTAITQRQMDSGAETTEIDGEDYEWLPDVSVSVDLDNNNTDFYSIFWEVDTEPDYLYSYTTVSPSDYNDGGSGEIGSSNTYNLGYLYRGPNVIGNITDYLKCFTNLAGSNYAYKVTVCVD